jgi:hypothetical protein
MACVYVKSKATSRLDKLAVKQTPGLETLSFASLASFPLAPVQFLDTARTINTSEPSLMFAADASGTGATPLDAFINLGSSENISSWDQWLALLSQDATIERPKSPVDEKTVMAYQNMSAFCVRLVSHMLFQEHNPLC